VNAHTDDKGWGSWEQIHLGIVPHRRGITMYTHRRALHGFGEPDQRTSPRLMWWAFYRVMSRSREDYGAMSSHAQGAMVVVVEENM
jgi:hypothetical protein